MSWAGVLLVYAAVRTVRPLSDETGRAATGPVLVEIVVHLLAVMSTGWWDSPYVFSLVTAIIAGGFARGFVLSLELAVACTVAISVPYHLVDADPSGRTTAQWVSILLLVGIIAGYARHLFGEAERARSLAVSRVGRLTEANELLSELHRVAQTLPASLDLDDVLRGVVDPARDRVDGRVFAVLLADETGPRWQVGIAHGTRVGGPWEEDELPSAIATVRSADAPVRVDDLHSAGDDGIDARSRSGLYTPLRSRAEVIGLLAVEHPDPRHFTTRDEEALKGLAEHAALAIDNSRFFARLRTFSADAERLRIARDLHDRVGQSLAYLAFELDGVVQHAGGASDELHERLERLRRDVRGVVTEVRETLYDLRTDVTEDQDFVQVMAQFLERVRTRSQLDTTLVHNVTRRPHLLQERELWRIAQEAVANAERHSGARSVKVAWGSDGIHTVLSVTDDGRGFEADAAQLDSYGLLGMRERASGIGARLDVDSSPGSGTRVHCVVGGPR